MQCTTGRMEWIEFFLIAVVNVCERVADVVLSTAHKAKGLEFDTVQLTDDFMHLNERKMFMLSGGLKTSLLGLLFNPSTVTLAYDVSNNCVIY